MSTAGPAGPSGSAGRDERIDPAGPDNDAGPGHPPGTVQEAMRTMALVDEVIGLRAELAELRHRLELSGVPTEAGAGDSDDSGAVEAAQEETRDAVHRAEAAEAALAAVLGSRSWKIGQRIVALGGAAARARRLRS